MRVVANGKAVELPDGSGLLHLFEVLGVGSRWVVAELNGEAIPRPAMASVLLAEGDRVEVVRAVAGG